MPWSVRGIDPDIREQAVEAAHRSGLSVGQWLNQVLAGNLDEGESEPTALRPQRAGSRPSRIAELNERLERLTRPTSQTAAHRFAEPEADNRGIVDLLETTIAAIERIETENAERARREERVRAADAAGGQAVEHLLKRLEQRMATLAEPAPAPSIAPDLEARLSAVLDQLERPAAREAAQPLAAFGRRAAAMPLYARAPRRNAEEDAAHAEAIGEIAARRRELDDVSRAARPAAARTGFAAQPQPRETEEQRQIGEIRSQLDTLLSRIDDMRGQPKPDTSGLSNRLEQIAGRIDEMGRGAKPDLTGLQARLEQIAGRIDDMRREPKPDAARLQDRLEQIAGRIEEWRTRPGEDVALIRRDLASLAAAIEQLAPERLVGMVENAVAGVAARSFGAARSELPDRIAQPLADMQGDIRDILRELASSRDSDRISHEISLLARRLDQIGRETPDLSRLEDILREAGQIKTLVGQAMRAQPLEGLAFQIETLGQQIERYQQNPRSLDDRAILDQIREVRDRLERIDPAQTFTGLEARLAKIAEVEARLGALTGIEQKLGEIASNMTKLAQTAKPLPGLESITQRLERIDRVLENGKGKPIAGLDRLAEKIERLDVSLEKVAEASKSSQGGHQDQLVALIEGLARRMDEVQAEKSGQGALDQLHAEIAGLSRRLEAQPAPAAAPGLDGIERQVADLFAQFESARRDMRDAAEAAAQRAAHEAVRAIPRDETTDTLAAEGLLLIKRDLGEFKNLHVDSERRTRQTLETLNRTLEMLVGRLGEIETRHAGAPPQPAPAPAKPAQAPLAASRAPAPAPAAEPRSSVPRPVAPPVETFHDLPLEPGQQPGRGAERGAAEAAEPGHASDPKTNFIAAARRAAQIASERSQAALDEEAEARKGRKGIRALMPDGLKTGTGGSLAFIAKSRKPILLGFAALLIAISAARMLLPKQVSAPDMPPPMAQPRIEERETPPREAAPAVPQNRAPEQRGEALEAPAATGAPPQNSALDGIPTLGPRPNIGGLPTASPPMLTESKRGQRLSEASAITQSDPMAVGSVRPDGSTRPVETGPGALADMVAAINLKGQDKLREAALAGHPAALFEIGARHADGRGVARDPKLAARWFEQAAAQGHAPSQYRLASLYREGRGTPKDSAIAFQWFDRAAAQGHVLAMHNAAVLLAEGVHGTPDYAGAALWFKRAAEHGIKDSQFNVAILYARGLGVNQDLAESFRWFAAAALQGDQDAAKKRDDIAARMPKDQLAKEREKLKTFKTLTPNPAANEAGSWEVPAQRQGGIPPRNARAN